MSFNMRVVSQLVPAAFLVVLGLAGGGCGRLKPLGSTTNATPGITISGETSLDLGASSTYTAVLRDATGKVVSGATVQWTASGALQLAATDAGLSATVAVEAASLGTGTLTATFGAQSGTLSVAVVAGPATVAILPQDGTPLPTMLGAGQMLGLVAVVRGENGISMNGTDAQWTQTGSCTTTATTGGQVTLNATAVGSCTVSVTALGLTSSADFTIVALTGIVVTGGTGPVGLGESRNLTAVAVAGTTQLPNVPVSWTQASMGVIELVTTGNVANVLGAAVGQATLTAAVAGGATSLPVPLSVVPATLTIAASASRIVAGGGAVVTVTATGTGGRAGRFATATGVTLAGATGFATVGPATLTPEGLVTFALSGASADSATVTASLQQVTSSAISFTLVAVTTVKITGPDGPVRAGSTVDLGVQILDAQGMAIAGTFTVTWADPTGVYMLPATTAVPAVTATAATLGIAQVVATVSGVSSAVFTSQSVPASVAITPFSVGSIAVGGTATTSVTVLDVNGVAIAGVPATDVTLATDDVGVTLSAGVTDGTAVTFTATGAAATRAAGADVTATWKSGVETVTSAAAILIVTGP
jgi:hypothetical protein